ncbi:MAG: oligopeptide:H+ symporter [Myxococcaceae bacterium]
MSTASVAGPAAAPAKMPRQIPFIIGNEACERFSFYGMRNVLTDFLSMHLLVTLMAAEERGPAAKEVFHTFAMGVYFFPLLGGFLADRLLGKYRVILWLSIVYCVGQFLLAFSVDSQPGFYTGLFLIALGSGGIKPCVASFVGDQFDQSNKHLAKVVFDAFYFIINFGSFFASLLMPPLLKAGWLRMTFAVPAILMAISIAIFWAGRGRYVNVKPKEADPNSFMNVCRTVLFGGGFNLGTGLAVTGLVLALASFALLPAIHAVATICLALVIFLAFAGTGVALRLDTAKSKHPPESIDGVRSVLRVLVLFACVTPFFSLFDQKATTIVLQANDLQLPGWSWFTTGSQMQALNPLLVMLLIPFNNLVLYPRLKKLGVEPTALRRMGFGIAFAGLAFVAVAVLQLVIDRGGEKQSILWQVVPYLLLTFGEVLVSATGLEFAYSQAPAPMKGVLMSFWNLATTVGNLWVLLVNATVTKNATVIDAIKGQGWGVMASQMFFFAFFAFAAAAAFAAYATRYTVVDNYRS